MFVCVAMGGGQGVSGEVPVITPTVTNTTDLTQVLSGLQNSGELTSVLQQQPHLVEGTKHCAKHYNYSTIAIVCLKIRYTSGYSTAFY